MEMPEMGVPGAPSSVVALADRASTAIEEGSGESPAPSSDVEVATPIAIGLELSEQLADRYGSGGPHPHYVRFRESVRVQTGRDAFSFIEEAVEGTGGFETGEYLDPHDREVEVSALILPASTTIEGPPSTKYRMRQKLADYDNFAADICDAYWAYILKQHEEIQRKAAPEIEGLDEFWRDVDLRGTSMTEFLSEPERQMRMYGWAVIVVDRPNSVISTMADEEDPGNRPYAYVVPTRNMVDWEFDNNGVLVAVTIAEPPDEKMEMDDKTRAQIPLRVWTRWTWSTWTPSVDPTSGAVSYANDDWGPNPIGEVPVVVIYNDKIPAAGKMTGSSEMKSVALLARTVYNNDSEIRELERNCAFIFLAISLKNPGVVGEVTLSTQGMFGYDGPNPPAWVSPDLQAMRELRDGRTKRVERAYSIAGLAAVYGAIQTTSGFHTEAEFHKTDKAVTRNAAMLEDAETKMSTLFLKWKGVGEELIRRGDLFSIQYPRNFGIRDTEALITRTTMLLSMNLGHVANFDFLRDLFRGLYPRRPSDEIDKLAEAAASEVDLTMASLRGFVGGVPAAATAEDDRRLRVAQRIRELMRAAGVAGATGVEPAAAQEPGALAEAVRLLAGKRGAAATESRRTA